MKVVDMKAAPEAELSHTATRGREEAKARTKKLLYLWK